MRASPVGHIILVVLIFPVIPFPFIIWVFLAGRKGIRLLRNGTAAMGTFKSMESTNVSSNNRVVMKLTFEFQANDGQTHTAVIRTSRPEFIIGQEAVNRHYREILDKTPVPKFLQKTGIGNVAMDILKNRFPVSSAPEGSAGPIQKPLLYDPMNPSYAVMLDSLPGDPHIDEEGRIRVKYPFAAIAGLIIPGIVIWANVAAAFHRYGR
jgi:hypothetical protein